MDSTSLLVQLVPQPLATAFITFMKTSIMAVASSSKVPSFMELRVLQQ